VSGVALLVTGFIALEQICNCQSPGYRPEAPILFAFGILGGDQLYNCDFGYCSAEIESRIFWGRVAFYSGLSLIAVGITLLFLSRRIKPLAATETHIQQDVY
jgi:hypothetical protein